MNLLEGKNRKASLAYVLAGGIVKGLSLIITPIVTRLLSPSEFGIYTLYVSYLSIVTVITTLEISGSSIYSSLVSEKNRYSFIYSLSLVSLCLSLLFSLIYLIFREQINAFTGISTNLMLILLFQVFLNCIESLYLANLRHEIKYKTVFLITVGSGILQAILTLLFITVLDYGGVGRIYAPLYTSLAIVTPMAISILKKGNLTFSKSVFSYIFKRVIPLLPHYISLSLMAQAGRIAISKHIGQDMLGKYGVAQSFALSVSIITVGLSNAIFPWINKHLQNKNFTRVWVIVTKSVFCVLGIVTLFLLFTPRIYPVFASGKYHDAVSVIYPLAIGVVFVFISGILSQIIYSVSSSKFVGYISILSAVLTVLLSFSSVQTQGILGVAFSLLFGEAFSALLKALYLVYLKLPVYKFSYLPFLYTALFLVGTFF